MFFCIFSHFFTFFARSSTKCEEAGRRLEGYLSGFSEEAALCFGNIGKIVLILVNVSAKFARVAQFTDESGLRAMVNHGLAY